MKIPDKKKLNKIKKASKKLEQTVGKSILTKDRIEKMSNQIDGIKINIEKGKSIHGSGKNIHRDRNRLRLIRENLKKEKNNLLQLKEIIKKHKSNIKTLKMGR